MGTVKVWGQAPADGYVTFTPLVLIPGLEGTASRERRAYANHVGRWEIDLPTLDAPTLYRVSEWWDGGRRLRLVLIDPARQNVQWSEYTLASPGDPLALPDSVYATLATVLDLQERLEALEAGGPIQVKIVLPGEAVPDRPLLAEVVYWFSPVDPRPKALPRDFWVQTPNTLN